MRRRALFASFAALLSLSACATQPPPVAEPSVPTAAPTPVLAQPPIAPSSAAVAGLTAGPPVATLPITAEAGARALRSFRESCPKLLRRGDASGLTRQGDWQPACAAAATWPDANAAGFWDNFFESVEIRGDGFVTGYFEPQISGVRARRPGFDVPVYGVPSDLTRQRDYTDSGTPPRGRYDESGRFVPYFERSEIVAGALDGRAPVIAWAADEIDFFFLQIQGSGQLIAPDGSVMRIGYADQNGRGYTAIGRTLRERGVFGPGEATMQGIVDWLRANPVEGRAVMNENQSWVFFRELTGDGPLGALEVPVRPRASVAADPNFVPLGAPVWIDAENSVADGLWIAQDTGGAIKGANRLDTFWGAGEQAKAIAGSMSSAARVIVLLPKGTRARLAQ